LQTKKDNAAFSELLNIWLRCLDIIQILINLNIKLFLIGFLYL